MKWFEPFFKNGFGCFISLKIYAADLPCTVVQIKVNRKLVPFRIIFSGNRIREMILDVVFRSMQSCLFTAPQRDTDGPSRIEAYGFQDAHYFKHYNTARTVIRSA